MMFGAAATLALGAVAVVVAITHSSTLFSPLGQQIVGSPAARPAIGCGQRRRDLHQGSRGPRLAAPALPDRVPTAEDLALPYRAPAAAAGEKEKIITDFKALSRPVLLPS
ncbi:uncharacterized protein PSFLO_02189 [Pseudozyma flocculosa]|uniref:Uncharacterized protein n=1 Tax=Pseudozyma flocculosa TaxID=84751 RepID=A0A5C3EWX0_9BASI|nr:uncharacterized protein PSFLO_02189 [Pseudozyma flocculosa]